MLKEEAEFIVRKVRFMARSVFRPTIVSHFGVKLRIGGHVTDGVRKSIYKGGYEGREVGILSSNLDSGDKVVDIGAGIGFLSCFCAQRIGDRNVCAVEANPLLINPINENFLLNSVAPRLLNRLISAGTETSFFIEKNFWSSSTVRRSDSAKEADVKTISLNEILREFKANFLIMDIEGGEKEVLHGLDFSPINKMLIELHPHVIGPDNTSALISLIIDKGMILDMTSLKGNVFFFYKG